MPKRTRSHRLEDISIQKFEQCLPERWVCRRKDKDYGVDLEVEIFDEDDEATGLLFYVQMKGTDDPARARTLAMKVDRLKYLSTLDSPSIVARYCSKTDSFYWMWLTNIFAQVGHPETETVTVRFGEDDLWSDNDPAAIVRTLRVYRTIRQAPRRLPIGLTIDTWKQGDANDFELRCAVADILAASHAVTTSSDPSACLPVAVHVDGEYLRAKIDVVASIGVHLRDFTRTEITAQLAYVLAYMASGYEFASQANDLAALIRARGFQSQSREIAATIAARLIDHPSLAADIASMNGLHRDQDLGYGIYINSLLSGSLPFEDRLASVTRFYTEALVAHSDEAPHRQSVIHYSFGNALLISGDMLGAVRQYNLARRKNPDYFQKDYFLAELAAALFFRRRYRIAAHLYGLAYSADAKPKVAICAGDAYLFSGCFHEAASYYELATGSAEMFESGEAALKGWITSWAEEFHARNALADHAVRLSDPGLWAEVLEQSFAEDRHDHALGACLMLCYLVEDTVQLWAQALSLAMAGEDVGLKSAVITCAVWVHGYAAYTGYRDTLSKHGIPDEVLREIDRVAAELYELRGSGKEDGVTVRFLGQHHYDTLVEVAEVPPNETTKIRSN